jgi:translation initiation factor 1
MYSPFLNDDSNDIKTNTDSSLQEFPEIHIRIQQRNGKKCITTIQGLDKYFGSNDSDTDLKDLQDLKDLKGMVRKFKKMFSSNGTILVDPDIGQIVQLQGDQRQNVAKFLISQNICTSNNIKIHGF